MCDLQARDTHARADDLPCPNASTHPGWTSIQGFINRRPQGPGAQQQHTGFNVRKIWPSTSQNSSKICVSPMFLSKSFDLLESNGRDAPPKPKPAARETCRQGCTQLLKCRQHVFDMFPTGWTASKITEIRNSDDGNDPTHGFNVIPLTSQNSSKLVTSPRCSYLKV
jgi:hypothetical protein